VTRLPKAQREKEERKHNNGGEEENFIKRKKKGIVGRGNGPSSLEGSKKKNASRAESSDLTRDLRAKIYHVFGSENLQRRIDPRSERGGVPPDGTDRGENCASRRD